MARQRENREHYNALARARHAVDPSKNTEAARRWHAKNPEYAAAYRAKNVEKSREATRRFDQKNPEVKRAWRENNPEKVRAYEKAYLKRHPEKVADKNNRRRARLSGAPEVEKIDRLRVFDRDAGRCHLCGRFVSKSKFTLDHLVPLARGGSHTYANVKIAHGSCNSRKGARFISQ